MIVRKGLKYRVYATPEQEAYLPRISGCVRLVFNLALQQREMFGRPGRSFRYEGQRAELKQLKAHGPSLAASGARTIGARQSVRWVDTKRRRFDRGATRCTRLRRIWRKTTAKS